jgi:hypothetical protein
MTLLRSKLVRLAHAHPEFRPKLLPLLERVGTTRTAARASRLKVDVRLKEGPAIPAGTVVTVEFDPHRASLAILKVEGRNEPVKVSTINLHKYLNGYKMPPSRATLERWLGEGVAQTVTGRRVETDGWGDDGSPSWFLVLNLV